MVVIMMTSVTGIICPKCGDFIYSRARHDFHWCSCKNVFVDGGFEYLRWGGRDCNGVVVEERSVRPIKETLYRDWLLEKNKYGVIKNKKRG